MIRAAGVGDIIALKQLRQYMPISVNGATSPSAWTSLLALSSAFPPGGRTTVSLVYVENGQLWGSVQARARRKRHEWEIISLSGIGQVNDSPELLPEKVFASLLEQLARILGERGAMRIFAKSPGDVPGFAAFALAGYSVYGHEDLFRLDGASALGVRGATPPFAQEPGLPEGATIRPQRDDDAWPIHQLYGSITPKVMQQAQGLSSDDWGLPKGRWPGNLFTSKEGRYVLEVEGQVQGFVLATRATNTLEIMVHPEAYHHAAALLRQGLSELAPAAGIYCALPEHQGGLSHVLEETGFRHLGSQALLVKHMVTRIRERERVLKPVLERGLEPAAKAPIYSNQKP
ncbi:MAG: hypothetical protein AB1566_04535 [Chloroflexota bacterium]